MDKKTDKRGLGRGLSALMADVNLDTSRFAPAAERGAETSLPIESIIPNPNQPRRVFETGSMQELTASIRQKGIIQPLIVRPAGDGRFEIVAGERRWRAAQAANLHVVPVVVRDFSDSEMLEIAIIENIQRADLNPLDEALAYRQLMDRFGHTQEKIAEGLSRSRSHIANLLRLLNLPADVQGLLRDGALTAGHARALVGHPDAAALAKNIVERGMSVRDVEDMVRREPAAIAKPSRASRGAKDADTRAIEGDLSASLGMPVDIQHNESGSGILQVKYTNLDELDLLCRTLALANRANLAD